MTVVDFHFDFDKTYYLSGPMNGYPEHNFPAFARAEGELSDSGINVLSPHTVVHHEPIEGEVGNLPPEEYLRGDIIAMLEKCSGIILLKGWPQSWGARIELDIALRLNWPVYYYHDMTLTCLNKDGHND